MLIGQGAFIGVWIDLQAQQKTPSDERKGFEHSNSD
jgi:hypothetical protein